MTFRVNQQVVCVDAAPEPGCSWGSSDAPVEGATYTVRAVIGLQLHLHEIKRSDLATAMHGPELGYWAWRFIPVTELKKQTSIEVLKKLLDGASRETERA